MKTNLAHLSRVYQDFVESGAGGETCIDPERLARCALGEMSRRERDESVGHAADCPACAAALKRLLSLSAEAEKAAADLGAYAGRRQAERARAREFWRRPAFVPVAAVAAGTLLLTASILFVPGFLGRSGTRGGAKAGLVLVSPVEEKVSAGGGVFKWEGVAGAASYSVEIFDGSMSLLWRSARTAETEVTLPAATVQKLAAGETYYWRVTALTEDFRETKSRLAEFSVAR